MCKLMQTSALMLLLTGLVLTPAPAEWQTGIDLRYRLEIVDDEGFEKDAIASTARLRLEVRSPEWSGVQLGLAAHGNRRVGSNRFNSTANQRTSYPVVADPDDEGVSEAWVGFRAGEQAQLRIGRQRIVEDNHRFIGNVGFRQLEQTFDAATLTLNPDEVWQINVRYLDRAHRVFGRSNPNRALARADLNAWMVSVGGTFEHLTLTGYAHRLVFDDRPASHRNLGARATGTLAGAGNLAWRAELARQDGLRERSSVSTQHYLHLRLSQNLETWHWFAGHERLVGDGEYAFQTPLATLHAHNGWTDRFLVTPGDGLIDTYVAAGTVLGSWQGLVKLHDFRSDHDSRRYGREYGVMITRPLPAGLAFEAKAAHFDGRQLADVDKLWLTLTGNW
jgi:hypothetical protein